MIPRLRFARGLTQAEIGDILIGAPAPRAAASGARRRHRRDGGGGGLGTPRVAQGT
ncbi:hypothetical protein [Baekduia soli]